MENSPQFYNKYYNHQNSSRKKTFHQTLEDHTLSLRKRKNNRQMQYEIPPELLNDVSYKINISEIEQKICKEELYLQYKNANNEKISLGFLFQMLLSKNDDLIKFSVGKIRDLLVNTNKKEFKEKNYGEEFNDKLIKFLFELLFEKSNDLFLLSNICFLLNKLGYLPEDKDNFYKIYINFLGDLLNLAKNIPNNETKVKNNLYRLVDRIFLSSNNIVIQLEKKYPYFAIQIHSELKNLEEDNKFVKNMDLISTLLRIINNCFFNEIYLDYFFSCSNNQTGELNAENIIKYIQKLLKFSFQEDIFGQEIRCIQNFLYFFIDKENLFENKNLKNKIINIIYDLKFEKKILPMIYDNTVNEPDLRLIALQILINATHICPKKFCVLLIENNISAQIIKLENYLLEQTQFQKKTKELYDLLLDLIWNLIDNESAHIIDNLAIKNNCISMLFKLHKIPFYSKDNESIIKIFNILISSNHKYIRTLLMTEGICELYKNILNNEPSNDDVEIIIKNLISMINYSDNFLGETIHDKKNLNLILIHLEKIGVYEVINNLKSRNDLSDSSIAAINEISTLFNHN